MDGGAALRAIAISASRSIRYGSIEAIVDPAEVSCACIRHGVEKPNINAKLKEANTANFRLRIVFSLRGCFLFLPRSFVQLAPRVASTTKKRCPAIRCRQPTAPYPRNFS